MSMSINLFVQSAKVDDLRSNYIMSQHLWDNTCILGQDSPIRDPYMSDKYQLKPADFFSWYGLLISIPKQWKKKL